jgi:hypothetical protein
MCCSLAGLSQINGREPVQNLRIVKFFPNPATTYINFELQQSRENKYSLQVYNFLGKKVMDLPQLTLKSKVDLTNFNRGVYVFQVRDKSGKVVESGKFQIEK